MGFVLEIFDNAQAAANGVGDSIVYERAELKHPIFSLQPRLAFRDRSGAVVRTLPFADSEALNELRLLEQAHNARNCITYRRDTQRFELARWFAYNLPEPSAGPHHFAI